MIPLAIPTLVFLMMVVVGMALLPADLRRVQQRPRVVLAGIAGQLVLLPMLAALIAWWLQLPFAIAAGMMLVAVCPGGALSNYYTLLARADVALSVTLTALSTLLTPLTLPLLASIGFQLIAASADAGQSGAHHAAALPVIETLLQLLAMLILPIAAGMWLRHRWPRWVAAHNRKLQKMSLVTLLALMTFIASQQPDRLLARGQDLLLAATVFTLASLALGIGLAVLVGLPSAGRFSVGMEYAARNLGVAAAVGVSILDDAGMVMFASAVLIVQIPLLLAVSLWQRSRASPVPQEGTRRR